MANRKPRKPRNPSIYAVVTDEDTFVVPVHTPVTIDEAREEAEAAMQEDSSLNECYIITVVETGIRSTQPITWKKNRETTS